MALRQLGGAAAEPRHFETPYAAPPPQRRQRIAELIRLHTGRHWIGIYTTGSDLIVPVFADGELAATLVVEDARTDAFGQDQALFESVAAALTDLYHYAAPRAPHTRPSPGGSPS